MKWEKNKTKTNKHRPPSTITILGRRPFVYWHYILIRWVHKVSAWSWKACNLFPLLLCNQPDESTVRERERKMGRKRVGRIEMGNEGIGKVLRAFYHPWWNQKDKRCCGAASAKRIFGGKLAAAIMNDTLTERIQTWPTLPPFPFTASILQVGDSSVSFSHFFCVGYRFTGRPWTKGPFAKSKGSATAFGTCPFSFSLN